MSKSFLLFILLFSFFLFESSKGQVGSSSHPIGISIQHFNATIPCATDILLHNKLNSDSVFRIRHEAMDNFIYQRSSEKRTKEERLSIDNDLTINYTIPVVVHIIHSNGPENISDVQIIQGIQDLNDAFSNTGPYNISNGVNMNIQFCLAKQDTNGFFTTGITRNVSSLSNMTMETDDIALKNLSRWNPTEYLNIWLVNSITSLSMGSGVAGYAYFPSSHGNPEDGIVNEAGLFGSSHDNSKVHIHEAGHYMGLYHTFEGGCTNNNCLTNGDHVCDTPPDGSVAGGPCSITMNTCSTDADDNTLNNPFRLVSLGGLGDQNDLIGDYMDYGFLPCHILFTGGQRDRMIAALLSERSSLLSSVSCNNLCTSPINCSFISDNDTVNVGTLVNFTNFSTGATAFNWTINGTPFSSSINTSYTFNSSGLYDITLTCTNVDTACASQQSIVISVECPIHATFQSSASNCIPKNSTLVFTNTTSGNNSYQWFKDGILVGTDTNLVYTFYDKGGFMIYLVAYNGVCYDTSSFHYIQVGKCEGKENAIWYFGGHAGLNFNSGTPVSLTNSSMDAFEGCVTMADVNGNLLFYSYGDSVWNRNHQVMPNSGGFPETYSSTESSLAVPFPEHPGKYFLFQTDDREDSMLKGLRYSMIDMSLQSGLGDVMSPKNILITAPVEEKLAGTMHCNGHDTWIMVHEWNSNRFLAYLVTNSGISTSPVVSAIGTIQSGNGYQAVGCIKFSNDGKWLAIVSSYDPLQIFNFDNSTGLLSNAITSSFVNDWYYGVEFSPDNKKLYVSEYDNTANQIILQYNLAAGNAIAIANSVAVVGTIQGVYDAMQLGIDGKIYFSNIVSSFSNSVGVINNPNALGTNCNVIANGVVLNSGYCQEGLPNFVSTSFFHDDLNIHGPDSICVNASNVIYSITPDFWSASSYAWFHSNNISVNTFNDSIISLNFSVAGTDTLVIRKNTPCGYHYDTLYIHVHSVNLDLGADTTICSGASLILNAGSGYSSYLWQDGSINQTYTVNSIGTYSVQVSQGTYCPIYDSIIVDMNNNRADVNLGNDTSICEGAIIQLNAGLGFSSYQWQDGSTNQTYTAWTTGTYWVQITKVGTCNFSDKDSILVSYDASVDINLGNDTTICFETSLTLSPGNEFVSYFWSDSSLSPSLTIYQPGTYGVLVISSSGCFASDSIKIESCSNDTGINIYPNPNDGNFSIVILNPPANDILKMDIFDSMGQLIKHNDIFIEANQGKKEFIHFDSASGVYIIHLNSSTINFTKKLLKL